MHFESQIRQFLIFSGHGSSWGKLVSGKVNVEGFSVPSLLSEASLPCLTSRCLVYPHSQNMNQLNAVWENQAILLQNCWKNNFHWHILIKTLCTWVPWFRIFSLCIHVNHRLKAKLHGKARFRWQCLWRTTAPLSRDCVRWTVLIWWHGRAEGIWVQWISCCNSIP